MGDVNWWLMAVAFALGLALTLTFTLRRATREVPVLAAAPAVTPTEVIKTSNLDAPTEVIRTSEPADDAEPPPGPHGPGTAAPSEDGSGPAGWDVKGNEDSMLYHTTESPHYGRTIAEVWFRDVESAEAAGFHRWDSGKSQRGTNKR